MTNQPDPPEAAAAKEAAPEPETTTFKDFLENVQPNTTKLVNDVYVRKEEPASGSSYYINRVALKLHCPIDGGARGFRQLGIGVPRKISAQTEFLTYYCGDCQHSQKTFALIVLSNEQFRKMGTCTKFGESPAFGPPIPRRLQLLMEKGEHKESLELFRKGQSAENQGMGIGAYAYYRRAVENQWHALLDRIISVIRQGDPEDAEGRASALETAKAEKRFSHSLELAKDAIPRSLRIAGQHNPIALLHSVFSEGLHGKSEQECLDLAKHGRTVLIELTNRVADLLREDDDLKAAVAALQNRSQTAKESGD